MTVQDKLNLNVMYISLMTENIRDGYMTETCEEIISILKNDIKMLKSRANHNTINNLRQNNE